MNKRLDRLQSVAHNPVRVRPATQAIRRHLRRTDHTAVEKVNDVLIAAVAVSHNPRITALAESKLLSIRRRRFTRPPSMTHPPTRRPRRRRPANRGRATPIGTPRRAVGA
ncbi:MAG: hypothetical protein OXC99_06510 [Chloroflexi bacterium]|nr:hypothetical protein [Chloroflexota bacterium]